MRDEGVGNRDGSDNRGAIRIVEFPSLRHRVSGRVSNVDSPEAVCVDLRRAVIGLEDAEVSIWKIGRLL